MQQNPARGWSTGLKDRLVWRAAHKYESVERWLRFVMGKPGLFQPNALRRETNKLLSRRRMERAQGTGLAYTKPSAGCPEEMFNANIEFFRWGNTPVPAGASPLNADSIAHLHQLSCKDCLKLRGSSFPLCRRGAAYYNLIKFGWDPVFDPEPSAREPILSKEGRDYCGNSKKVAQYPTSTAKAFGKYISSGSAERLPPHTRLVQQLGATDNTAGLRRGSSSVVVDSYVNESGEVVPLWVGVPSPMGFVLKRTEVMRGLMFTINGELPWKLWSTTIGRDRPYSDYKKFYAHVKGGVDIRRGDEHLAEANAQLEAQGFPPIKGRATIDTSASDINARAWTPPFTCDISAADILFRGAVMVQGDLATYFLNFPLAFRAWSMFVVFLAGAYWRLRCCCFGFGPCPYYCSAWSAEIRAWLKNIYHIPCVNFMDNFLSVGKDEAEALARLELMESTVRGPGFSIPRDYPISRQMVYLGILYDTDKMVMSIDRIKAMALLGVLQEALGDIRRRKPISATNITSIAGRLESVSQVWQSGRVYTRIWWTYLKHGQSLFPHLFERLENHTGKWIEMLKIWTVGEISGREIPLWTWDVIKSTPGAFRILQSDSSGLDDHGFGYIKYQWVGFEPEDKHEGEFVAQQWDEGYRFIHSHHGELQPLLHHLKESDFTECFLLFLSDNESAVWGINKGSCKDEISLQTLVEILDIADSRKIQLLGMWIPREENEVPDYLTHLTNILSTHLTTGRIEEDVDFSPAC